MSGTYGSDGGHRGDGGREEDWKCLNPSCGNLNSARRVECNKCGAPSPGGGCGGGGHSRGGGGGGGGYNRGDSGGGYNRGGRGYGSGGGGHDGNHGYNWSSSDRGRVDCFNSHGREGGGNDKLGREDEGAYGGLGREDTDYAEVPPPMPIPSGASGSHPSAPSSYGGSHSYGFHPAPPAPYGEVNSLPPTYGAPPQVASHSMGDVPQPPLGGGAYGAVPVEPSSKIKQCDENCGDYCDNSRIYISNLPLDVTTDELRDLFGGIGQIGRIKQKRGYKDQWPWNIKIYTDEAGNNKGDAVLSYEDPAAAHSAGGFYNNHIMRGYPIKISMAEKSAPKPAPTYSHGGGRGGYGGGGDRRKYRDSGGSGPDRHNHGSLRARPY